MELGIVLALSYMGLKRNTGGRTQRYVNPYPDIECNPYPYTQQQLSAYTEQLKNVPPSQMPAFSSQAKQHTSDFEKSRKLELFTGERGESTITGTVDMDKGVVQPFPINVNNVPVGSDGKIMTPTDSYVAEIPRQYVSNKQNCVGPCEKIRVGPGLGLGSDVAAAGGLQQGYRILPTNRMNFERLNREQGGRVVPGQAPILMPGQQSAIRAPKNERGADMTHRTMLSDRANYTAGQPVGYYTKTCFERPSDSYCGNPVGANGQFMPGSQGRPTRHRNDGTAIQPILNPISLHESSSGYLNAPNNRAIKSQREQSQPVLAGAMPQDGAYTNNKYCLPPTNREDYTHNSLFTSNPAIGAPAPRTGYCAAPTNRESQPGGYLGPATGNAAFARGGGQVQIRNNREELVGGRTPGPQKFNTYNSDVMGLRLKDDVSVARGPNSDKTYGDYARPGAMTACKPRLPEHNLYNNDQVVQAAQRQQLLDNDLYQPFVV